jgi:nitrogen fixation/metabolism regulation signal transduction histidine kinase
MKQIYALFSLQMQTLVMFAMFLAFIYFPNQHPEINLLPFEINVISWRAAWYYFVIFGLLWIFVFLRTSLLKSLDKGIPFRKLLVANALVAGVGLFVVLIPAIRVWALLMMLLSVLLVLIDGSYYFRANKMPFMSLVFTLFVFVVIILTVVNWQNDCKRLNYSAEFVEYCRTHSEWDYDFGEWSVAEYIDSKKVKSYGESYDYPLFYEFRINREGLNYIRVRDGAEHFVYSYGNSVYIVSIPSWSSIYRFIVNFTYIFALYLVLTFIGYYFLFIFRKRKSTFFSRLQYTIIGFFCVSMVFTFFMAALQIRSRHIKSACYNQRYRMQFVVDYLTPIINSSSDCDSVVMHNVEHMADLLKANISLYRSTGEEFLSAGGVVSHPINLSEFKSNPFYNMPEAVYARVMDMKGESVVQSYSVLMNCANEPVYMLMSSKAEMVKLNRNLTLFFVLLFNLFFIVMIVGVFLSYLISRRLSAPLSIIEHKMRNIDVTGENSKIDYPIVKDDALSQLVVQYNSLIDKLAISVEELAQTEREMSWRQMARQMAHEIKNPLTPMQLLVQRLLMQGGDNLQEYKESVHLSAKALLKGIESITTTTEALSNFAKTPMQPLKPINLVESVRYAVDLFCNNEESVKIDFTSSLDSAMVLVDKEMIGSVFNNLLKNAIQSIPSDREGEILVKIYHNITDVIVSVKDNGIGIPDENREKLFDVNFTTKTKGMGLGLIVVKNVVEQAKGTIDFNSIEGEGTTFIVSFPLHK